MKLSDVVIGGTVYFKKSSITGIYENPNTPFVVMGIESNKRRRVVLNKYRVSAGELTDTPCEQMTCEKCKYHPREVKNDNS